MDEWFCIAFVSLNAVSKTHYWTSRKLLICDFLRVSDPRTCAPYLIIVPTLALEKVFIYLRILALWLVAFGI
jgi:hypothetical protein